MTDVPTPSAGGPTCCSGGRSGIRFFLGLAALLLVVGYLQWPMLKGLYYRAAASPADGIAWRTDLSAALAESARTGKPVLADFSATWCPPCQIMKHEVWPDGQVQAAVTAHYVPVLIDPDVPANRAIMQRYAVRGVPTILILDSAGVVVRQANFLTRDAMLGFLDAPAMSKDASARARSEP